MKLEIRNDVAILEGYINVTERSSKKIPTFNGYFIEQIKSGAFQRALDRNNDIKLLKNHDWNCQLGSTSNGVLELNEDNVGLHFRAKLDVDSDVVQTAMSDNVYCSFGFVPLLEDRETVKDEEYRYIRDMELHEVSLLVGKAPAYSGCVVMTRDEEDKAFEIRNLDKVEVVDNRVELPNYSILEQEIEYLKLKNSL